MEKIFEKMAEELNDAEITPEICRAVMLNSLTIGSNLKIGFVYVPELIHIKLRKKPYLMFKKYYQS